ncbi:hypothetical protein PRIPAC_79246 [Pristionchus pacificus]|uniref:Uncharacterized protein n=1 Tax=Pristionchus pacificus TaxID=54126 RepID=A0A8R1V5N0_PRIPA|nr:hypothetical protein PRIPAC_79246 [Pristionchus pacificus]
MNYSAIISSFLLAGGAVMILISQQGSEFDDEANPMSGTSSMVVMIIGIVLAVIGTLGFTFTVLQVIRRSDQRMREKEMRKLEVEVQRKMDIAISRKNTHYSRKDTQHSQVPSIMISTAST